MALLTKDRELLNAFRAGENAALRTVYREYASRVAGYCSWKFEMSSVDISEIVQITFVRAFREEARLSYDGLRPYSSYLIRIAHNSAINELKRPWRNRETESDEFFDENLDTYEKSKSCDTENPVFSKECKTLIEGLFSELSEIEKKVFELRFTEEIGQEAVAKALDLTRQNIRTIEIKIRRKAVKVFRSSGYLSLDSSSALALLAVFAQLYGELP